MILRYTWLRDKRTRYVVEGLPSLLLLISLFVGFANQFGYFIAILIAISGAGLLLFIANQVVEKTSPQASSSPQKVDKGNGGIPEAKTEKKPPVTVSPHSICDAGP